MTTSSKNRLAQDTGTVTIEVDSALSGQRLDRGLAVALAGTSRTRIQAAIAAKRVKVNGRLAKASTLLEAGMRIEVSASPELESEKLKVEEDAGASRQMPTPLAIVYEDRDLLVVDKPAGLVVHPAPGHQRSTLVDGLLSHVAELRMMGGTERPGIVHRLDKDTSGLLVVAKNAVAHASLADQMKSHATIKRYLALVEGQMSVPEGVVDAPIGRDPRNRQRMAIVRAGGRVARTRFRTLRYAQGRTLLEVQLESGRTHQIRVHLAAIHHPIVGDRVYGRTQPPEPTRQFLHAAHLEFLHPSTQEWMAFDAPLPADLAAFAAPWISEFSE
ncbi:MAG: RluA family pseudouridine synthase [Ktedonobacterales bacterium]